MNKVAWSGLCAMLWLASPGAAAAQDGAQRQRDASRDTVEMASDPLVEERDFFILELEIGVFIERTCITVESLEFICRDILEPLREIRPEFVDEMQAAMEEELESHLSDRMEEWVKERVGNSVLRAAGAERQ